jgi:hypothetical protein
MQTSVSKKPSPTAKAGAKTAPATKFATVAAVEPPPIYVEQKTREDEHAEAIARLKAEVEALKVNAAEMQQAMDQKMKLYIKMLIGGMSVLGMFDIFR